MTRVSVFGLGYVGTVTAACLAEAGHQVTGVDVNPTKLAMIRSGTSPVVEPGMDEVVAEAVSSGRLHVTDDADRAVDDSDLSLLCVGTPSRRGGGLDLSALRAVATDIGRSLKGKGAPHTIVVRSTILPTSIADVVAILEDESGLRVGEGFGFAVNPEFLREGSSLEDFRKPVFTLIGEHDSPSGDAVESLYSEIDSPVIRTSPGVATLVKYASNSYHALKVAFANEIGTIAREAGVDGRTVLDIFTQDHHLNISAAYLRPGAPFGGSCLPKDTRALAHHAKQADLDAPLLSSILPSNANHLQRIVEIIERQGRRPVGVFGLSFKSDTDDVRESPAVPLIEYLVGKGFRVSIYDRIVELSRMLGANRAYLETKVPHIASLISSDIERFVSEARTIIIVNRSKDLDSMLSLLDRRHTVIDLIGIDDGVDISALGGYEGACW